MTSIYVFPSPGEVYFKPDQLAWLMALVGDEAMVGVPAANQLSGLNLYISVPESVPVAQ